MTLEEKMIEYEEEAGIHWWNMEEFTFMKLDFRVTTNTTTLKRINSYKTLVFGGNRKGVIGYGIGVATKARESL